MPRFRGVCIAHIWAAKLQSPLEIFALAGNKRYGKHHNGQHSESDHLKIILFFRVFHFVLIMNCLVILAYFAGFLKAFAVATSDVDQHQMLLLLEIILSLCSNLLAELVENQADNMGRYSSGQRGQTVNLLASAFGGSNPSLPTMRCVL